MRVYFLRRALFKSFKANERARYIDVSTWRTTFVTAMTVRDRWMYFRVL